MPSFERTECAIVPCRECGRTSRRHVAHREYVSFDKNLLDEQFRIGVIALDKARKMGEEGRICGPCKLAKSPSFEHNFITLKEAEQADGDKARILAALHESYESLRGSIDSLMGRDIMAHGQPARIIEASFHYDYRPDWTITYQYYSKNKYSKGELVGDPCYTRFEQVLSWITEATGSEI